MTTKLIPIKKVLRCPFCQEGSTGLIYPDGALAEAHSDGGMKAYKWICGFIPVLLVLLFYTLF